MFEELSWCALRCLWLDMYIASALGENIQKNEVQGTWSWKLILNTKDTIFLPVTVPPLPLMFFPVTNPRLHRWGPHSSSFPLPTLMTNTDGPASTVLSRVRCVFFTPGAAASVQTFRISPRGYFLLSSFHRKIIILLGFRWKQKDIQRSEVCTLRSLAERANVLFLRVIESYRYRSVFN